jgi:hypothetical protein
MDSNCNGMENGFISKNNLKKKKVLSVILSSVMSSIMLISCLPDPLPVENIPSLEPKITVASQIIPNQGLVVFLTKSIGALDAGDTSDPEDLLEQIVINDAVVTLQYNNETDTLAFLGSGLYGGVTIREWQERITYELKVKSAELGEVNAFAQVQDPVPFQTAEAKLYITQFDSLAEINYSLNDPPGRNFYMVNVQKFSATQGLASLLNPDVFTHLVEDTDFDGELFQDQFRVFFRDFSEGDTVSVFLSNIQKEYYEFLTLRNDNRYNFADFASEPVNYPSNVNGGLGFFQLYVPDVRLFILEE